MNYLEHNKELHGSLFKPEEPVIFTKADSAVLKDHKPFFIPDHMGRIDYETEIVVRISKLGKNISERFAHRYYDAVTVGIDFTARELQKKLRAEGKPWDLCKGFDGSAALGEWVSLDKFRDIQALHFHLDINGNTVQEGCTSDMLYKYVLDGHSVGAFAGLVLVEKGAQKSLSQQTNANICAAPTARAFSQPMLEIYADDVKCNHGSTIGKLDESALFYMRQRGIPEREARLILQQAFVGDVLRHIELERLRERLVHLVEMRFRGELSACAGCKMCR